MHGYGYPPEQPSARPSSATLTVLRVVFVALAVLTCGFLAWAAMLRLAIVTRRPRDWWLLTLCCAVTGGFLAFAASIPADAELTDTQSAVTFVWMVLNVGGVVWYYLFQEIRHYRPRDPRTALGAVSGYGAGPAQGYPPPVVRTVPPQIPQIPPYGVAPPATPYRAAPQQAQPTPPPRRPGPPQRLDQVRAELDELSDYLRKEGEGR